MSGLPSQPPRQARHARQTLPARPSRPAQAVPASPPPASPWLWGGAAAALVLMLAALAWWWLRPAMAPAPMAGPAASTPTAAAPLPVLSAAQWLAGHATDWRTGRLQEEPAVVVIEFPSLAEQGAAMNRIAALLEKTGAPRNRVLGDAELATLIARGGDTAATFYQGHDYGSVGLAHFFTLAQAQGQALNPREQRVLGVLMHAGVIAAAAGGAAGYKSPSLQALITYPAVVADDPATPGDETIDARQRESIFRHEASHGRYYTRPKYQAHSQHFWLSELTEPQRERIRRYLAGAGYDRQNEELMLNEAQAFLMHTPDQRAFMPQDIGMSAAELEALRERFWRTLPPE